MPKTSASDLSGRDSVERFRCDVAGLDITPSANAPLALAVSGGPDSMAMLWLAAAAYPGAVIAATVDHGLRPDSADEAAMVGDWCAAAAIPHAALVIAGAPGASGNMHAWARRERYGLLSRWALDHAAVGLCTAHHADDQAETFVMRAARGAGITGLSGIRARQEFAPDGAGSMTVALLRPLLAWRRADLRLAAEAAALPFVDDPSNVDPHFQRARMRAWLATAPWLDPGQLARAAGQLAAVNDDLDALATWLWDDRATRDAAGIAVDIVNLPREIRRRLTRLALAAIEAMEVRDGKTGASHADANIESLLDSLENGRAATQGDVAARPDGKTWHFSKAPPRRSH